MNSIANAFYYVSMALFILGATLNIKYLITLPFSIPDGSRWAAYVWLIMLVGLGQWLGRDLSITGAATIDSSAKVQVASVIIAAFVALMMMGKAFQMSNFKLPFTMLFLFSLLGVITAPISDVPMLSVFKAGSLAVAVFLAVMIVKTLADYRRPDLVFNIVYIYFVFLSFLAVIGGAFMPALTHRPNDGVFGYMLEGFPSLNSNSLSYVAAVAFVVSVRRLFMKVSLNRRVLYLGACSVGFVTLVMAQGRTSLISSTLAILFMSFYIKDMRPLRMVMVVLIFSVLAYSIVTGSVGNWVDSLQQYMQRGVTDEQIGTLSGRTDAWAYSWQLFLNSPISGYGFYAAGKTLLAPHNAYFTILLNGGIIGFIPWLIGVWAGMWLIVKSQLYGELKSNTEDNNFHKEIIAVLIVQFIRTITGQDLTIHSYSMLIFLSAIIYVLARRNISNPKIGCVHSMSEKNDDNKKHHPTPVEVEQKLRYTSVRLKK